MYAGISKGGNPHWGDLEENILEKDREDPNEKDEEDTNIANIYSHWHDKDERPEYQKDSDFPHAGVMPSKRDKSDPKESDEDSESPLTKTKTSLKMAERVQITILTRTLFKLQRTSSRKSMIRRFKFVSEFSMTNPFPKKLGQSIFAKASCSLRT